MPFLEALSYLTRDRQESFLFDIRNQILYWQYDQRVAPWGSGANCTESLFQKKRLFFSADTQYVIRNEGGHDFEYGDGLSEI